MTTRKKPTATSTAGVELIPPDTNEALQDFFDVLAGDDAGVIEIWGVPQGAGRTAKWTYHRSVSPDTPVTELLDFIAEEIGGGDYVIKGVTKDERGKQTLKFNRKITIADRRSRNALALTRPEAGPVAPAPIGGDSAIIQALNQQTDMLGRVLDRVTQPTTAADPMSMIEHLGKIKDLFSPAPAQGTSLDALGMVKQFMEIRQLISDEDGGATGSGWDLLGKALHEFGPVIAKGVQMMSDVDRQRIAKALTVQAPGGVGRPVDEIPATAPPAEPGAIEAYLLRWLPTGVTLQRAGQMTPQTVAEMVVRHTPDELVDVLLDYIDDADIVRKLSVLNADVAEAPEWWTHVADGIFETLTPDEAEADAQAVRDFDQHLQQVTPAPPGAPEISEDPPQSSRKPIMGTDRNSGKIRELREGETLSINDIIQAAPDKPAEHEADAKGDQALHRQQGATD